MKLISGLFIVLSFWTSVSAHAAMTELTLPVESTPLECATQLIALIMKQTPYSDLTLSPLTAHVSFSGPYYRFEATDKNSNKFIGTIEIDRQRIWEEDSRTGARTYSMYCGLKFRMLTYALIVKNARGTDIQLASPGNIVPFQPFKDN